MDPIHTICGVNGVNTELWLSQYISLFSFLRLPLNNHDDIAVKGLSPSRGVLLVLS